MKNNLQFHSFLIGENAPLARKRQIGRADNPPFSLAIVVCTTAACPHFVRRCTLLETEI